MALDKAIASGKEKRKPYRKSKRFDSSCYNHGSCPWCEGNRQWFDKKHRTISDEKLNEWRKEWQE